MKRGKIEERKGIEAKLIHVSELFPPVAVIHAMDIEYCILFCGVIFFKYVI
jgi:hypothetical protein